MTFLPKTLQWQVRVLRTEGVISTQALPWAQHCLAPASSSASSPTSPAFRDLATLSHFHASLSERYGMNDVFLFPGDLLHLFSGYALLKFRLRHHFPRGTVP